MSVTVLTAIKSPEDSLALRDKIRGTAWKTIEQEFFVNIPALHMARLQIVEHLTPAMGDESLQDHLYRDYLLLIAEIDGRSIDFYDNMYAEQLQPLQLGNPIPETAGQIVRDIWGHCEDFPEQDGIYLFRQYMHQHEIKADLPYRAVPQSRDQILKALCLKEITAVWFVYQQSLISLSPGNIQDFTVTTQKTRQLCSGEISELYNYLFTPDPDTGVAPYRTFTDIQQKVGAF